MVQATEARTYTVTAPNITIFVRHTAGCTFDADEFSRKCNCRKSLRWYKNKKLYVKSAKTRSWTEAERVKRDLEDQFSGKVDQSKTEVKSVEDAVNLYLTKKKIEKVSDGVLKTYRRQLDRLKVFCDKRGIYTVAGITPEVLILFADTWETLYPSSLTRASQRERIHTFLEFCFQLKWLDRVPDLPTIKRDEPETQPLTPEEYAKLLDVVYVTVGNGDPRRHTTKNGGGRSEYKDGPKWQHAVYAFLQTMRYTGLAIIDTMTLRRDALVLDTAKGVYRVKTKRYKTGTPINNRVPTNVAEDLLKVEIGGTDYFFWSGNGNAQSATSNWGQRYIAPCFKAAGITSEGNMLSHRLRDTYAVNLLEKGVPMEEVARALGNTIRICEKHYAKWSKGRQDRLDTLIGDTFEVPPKPRNRPGRKPLGAKPGDVPPVGAVDTVAGHRIGA